ncbi:hypothetical protein QUF76_14720 [Desulfobacterales bacterium HSG16]|nr:hypothetical protein [Desulfobacterales bacterium HSG16]
MQWSEIRKSYPNQWLVIEAIHAHTTLDNLRKLDEIAVIQICSDGASAMKTYRRFHQQHSLREFYFIHTGNEEPNIRERRWIGIRTA